MATNADKKSEARAKREEAQAAAAAAQKRNRNLQVLGGLVLAAVAVVILVVIFAGKDNKPQGIDADAKGEVAGLQATTDLLKGIKQDGMTIGETDAPVTLLEFIDLQCPYCKEHQLDNQPALIKNLVRTGKAKMQLVPLAFLGEDSAAARATMLRLAAVNRGWEFVNLMYWNQQQENTGYVTPAYLAKLATAAGGKASDNEPRTPNGAGAKIAEEADKLQTTLLPGGPSTPTFFVVKTGEPLSKATEIDVKSTSDPVGTITKAVTDAQGV